MHLNSEYALVFWAIALVVMSVARESAGERGLVFSALVLGIVGAVAIYFDPRGRPESFEMFAAALAGAVVGLWTRRRLPLAGAVIVAALLSVVAFVAVVFSMFRW